MFLLKKHPVLIGVKDDMLRFCDVQLEMSPKLPGEEGTPILTFSKALAEVWLIYNGKGGPLVKPRSKITVSKLIVGHTCSRLYFHRRRHKGNIVSVNVCLQNS